jgi:hypothetical protein
LRFRIAIQDARFGIQDERSAIKDSTAGAARASRLASFGPSSAAFRLAIATVVLGFNFLGDGLRDRIDPKTG